MICPTKTPAMNTPTNARNHPNPPASRHDSDLIAFILAPLLLRQPPRPRRPARIATGLTLRVFDLHDLAAFATNPLPGLTHAFFFRSIASRRDRFDRHDGLHVNCFA